MDCSMPGFPVHHQLLELSQTHVLWVVDAIQPSHSLSPSPSAFNLSQHQVLFQWVSSLWPKNWNFSFSISPSNEYSGLTDFFFFLWLTYLISLLSRGLSRVFSRTTIQKHQFFSAQPSLQLVTQMVKNLPVMWETWVQSLGQEDFSGKEMATHSTILAWRIPRTEEAGGLQSVGW